MFGYINILTYADDVALLTPSWWGIYAESGCLLYWRKLRFEWM